MVTEPPVPKLAPSKAANIQLEDNVGKWAGYSGPTEDTWVRGTTNDKMVPASLSYPPKAANVQLEDNTGKWAGFSGPIEKTWVRGTTDAAMVTEPPVPKLAPSKAANI